MKRIILISIILLWGDSLIAQPEGFWDKFDRIYKTVYVTAGDSNLFHMPVKFESSITITTIPIEPPTSFSIQIAIPIDQIEKKSSPRHDLKAKITQLLPIALAMYIFRDELTEFSNRHDKISHALLSFGLAQYFGLKFAIGFMLSVELTQADDFGISGRYKDTAGDLVANSVGLLLSWRF